MTDRIIDISSEAARLRVSYDQLVIETGENDKATLPLAELACLVVSNPRVGYTHAVLDGIVNNGASMIVCDSKHLPSGMLLPIAGHYTQTERFRSQAAAPEPLRKRLWKQIVVNKIGAQGTLLEKLTGSDKGLLDLASRVKSGDSDNMEARASKKYWSALFDDPKFRRQRDAEDQNRFLNYGYAVLRAIVARSICGAGLHPSLGIHHHNRYDAFCLADDLMEPFRPLVDRVAVGIVEEMGKEAPMDKEVKRAIIEPLTGRIELDGERRTLFDICARVSSSLVAVYAGKAKKLNLPDFRKMWEQPENVPG